MEKITKEIGYDFDGLHIPEIGNSNDTYSVAYSQFIMPIVKSIQEQQTIIETQKNQIANLQKENAELKREQEKQKQTLEKIIQKLIELEKK